MKDLSKKHSYHDQKPQAVFPHLFFRGESPGGSKCQGLGAVGPSPPGGGVPGWSKLAPPLLCLNTGAAAEGLMGVPLPPTPAQKASRKGI